MSVKVWKKETICIRNRCKHLQAHLTEVTSHCFYCRNNKVGRKEPGSKIVLNVGKLKSLME